MKYFIIYSYNICNESALYRQLFVSIKLDYQALTRCSSLQGILKCCLLLLVYGRGPKGAVGSEQWAVDKGGVGWGSCVLLRFVQIKQFQLVMRSLRFCFDYFCVQAFQMQPEARRGIN